MMSATAFNISVAEALGWNMSFAEQLDQMSQSQGGSYYKYIDGAVQTAMSLHGFNPDDADPVTLQYYQLAKTSDGKYRMINIPYQGYHLDWTLDAANNRLVLEGSANGFYATHTNGTDKVWIQARTVETKSPSMWASPTDYFGPTTSDYVLQLAQYNTGTHTQLYQPRDTKAYPLDGTALMVDTGDPTHLQSGTASTDRYVDIRLDIVWASGAQTSPINWTNDGDKYGHPKPVRCGQLNYVPYHGGGNIEFPWHFPYFDTQDANLHGFSVRSRDLANYRITYQPITGRQQVKSNFVPNTHSNTVDGVKWRYFELANSSISSAFDWQTTTVGSGDDGTGDIVCKIRRWWCSYADLAGEEGYEWDRCNRGRYLMMQTEIVPVEPFNLVTITKTGLEDPVTKTVMAGGTATQIRETNWRKMTENHLVFLNNKTTLTLDTYGNGSHGVWIRGKFKVEKSDDAQVDWLTQYLKDYDLWIAFDAPDEADEAAFMARQNHDTGLTNSLNVTSTDYDYLTQGTPNAETPYVRDADGKHIAYSDGYIYFSKLVTPEQMQAAGITDWSTSIGVYVQINYQNGWKELYTDEPTERDPYNPIHQSYAAYTVRHANDVTTSLPETVARPQADAPAEYYDLSGRRIAGPVPGVYIVRRGAAVTKVVSVR